MELLSFFSGSKISPAWKFSAEHVMWRIMFSHHGVIIGEDRDTEQKTVSFFCLDVKNGAPLWKQKKLGEDWWIGLDAVTKERLYLHGFRKPDMPEHKNIIAVDLQSGAILWQNNECTFSALAPPYVYGFKDLFERRVYYVIDEQTGSIIEELQALPEGISPNVQYEKTDFTFPEPTGDLDGIPAEFFSKNGAFHSAEMCVAGGFSVLSIYTRLQPPLEGLKNSLLIIDSSTKKKVYSDVLNESTPYPVPDSFFLDGDIVYYIKERKTFVAINLSQGRQ